MVLIIILNTKIYMLQKSLWSIVCLVLTKVLIAQGPPILLDKPIMLGANKGTLRSYIKINDMKPFDFNTLMVEADYNLSNQIAFGVEIPINHFSDKINLGDLSIMGKYQFYKKDGIGNSTRIAVKAKQMFPTGKKLETMVLGMGHAMSYLGLAGARESLKLGVQSELGYYFAPSNNHLNFLSAKLGFGLPLLKPSYPVNQLNLYLESEANFAQSHLGESQYGIYLAPGIQYAKGIYTFDFSYQFPVAQNFHNLISYHKNSAVLLGARIII